MNAIVHIYAPAASHVWAVTNYNCPHRDGQGRRCGSYGAVARLTPWLGLDVICRCCGKHVSDGEMVPGRSGVRRVRLEFDELLARGAVDMASGETESGRRERERWDAQERETVMLDG